MEPQTVPKYFTLSPTVMGVLVVVKDGLLYPVGTSALIGEGWIAFSLLIVRGIVSKIIDISDVRKSQDPTQPIQDVVPNQTTD